MKTTIISLALVVAFFFTNDLAASSTHNRLIEKNAKESVRREISRSIMCPDFIKENNPVNQVKALVEVDEKGNVKVDEINSANPQLKAYVVDQLQNMTIKNPGQGQKFVLVINFQVG